MDTKQNNQICGGAIMS